MDKDLLNKYVETHSDIIIENIKRLYTASGMTQDNFADLMKWTPGKISHTENKRNKLSMEYVLRATQALGVGICDICTDRVIKQKHANIIIKIRNAIERDDPALDYVDKILK